MSDYRRGWTEKEWREYESRIPLPFESLTRNERQQLILIAVIGACTWVPIILGAVILCVYETVWMIFGQ